MVDKKVPTRKRPKGPVPNQPLEADHVLDYLERTGEALDKLRVAAPPRSHLEEVAADFLGMAEAYHSDGLHFYKEGDLLSEPVVLLVEARRATWCPPLPASLMPTVGSTRGRGWASGTWTRTTNCSLLPADLSKRARALHLDEIVQVHLARSPHGFSDLPYVLL